jgi:lipopolysaccharide transport system ATP-binding protein
MSNKEPIIKVENISKQYRLGTVGTGTLSHDLNRWWHNVRGKEDPYLKVGDVNDRASSDGSSDYVWALKDINFEVQPGEILGIIGKNGAGKSTLLKLLSRVTAPSTGKITCHGRIASLLEVGTGFHPELSGRENIYLNGAILGMTKKEITAKFDEIVDFAGCGKYIETPVKRYSSGMYVRLAFAVAAHLEPDILVVDEVLAVGDAEFQKKAIGKMQEVSQNKGRTVLFVSHNMGAVRNLCTRAIILKNGIQYYSGSTESAIQKYLSVENSDNQITNAQFEQDNNKIAQIIECKILNSSGDECSNFDCFDDVVFDVTFKINSSIGGTALVLDILKDSTPYIKSFDTDNDENLLLSRKEGIHNAKITLKTPLKKGRYDVSFSLVSLKKEYFDSVQNIFSFYIDENSFDPTFKSFSSDRNGLIIPEIEYKYISHNNDFKKHY